MKAQLLAVESDQKDVELALEDSSNLTLPNYLKGLTREQLRDELKQLREKEKQLRDEKSLLLQLKLQLQLQQPGYAGALPASPPTGPRTLLFARSCFVWHVRRVSGSPGLWFCTPCRSSRWSEDHF